MNHTHEHAVTELALLARVVPDAIVTPFTSQILALCDAFGQSGQSGQSGGSAPFTARAIAQAVRKLCLQQPICPITGSDEEWHEAWEGVWQNKRLSSVFKDENGPYYLEAVVFQGENNSAFTGNSVELTDGSTIGSAQDIMAFPFAPKTFYIDVIETEWADKEESTKQEGGGWWTSIVKDESQLDEVWDYYRRRPNEA